MIERLFSEDRCQHLLAGPMGPHVDLLAERLTEQRYSDSQSRKLIRTASVYSDWLAAKGLRPEDAGRAELRTYLSTRRRTPAGRLPEGAIGLARLAALLKDKGIFCKSNPASPADPWLQRFQEHLTNVRGVSSSTQVSYRRYVRPMILGICEGAGPNWSLLTPAYITAFVLQKTSEARALKGRIVSAVRAFLRFLISNGIVPPQLVRAIPRIRRWRYAELPKRLSADDLTAVLSACHSSANGSRRDRAFVALLARLGVRSGELRHLHLEDIDWNAGLLHIRQSKTGRGRTLPLPKDAGTLLAEYIRHERPDTPYREIFITSMTPRRPLHECSTTTFVKVFLQKLGLDGPGRGCHSFRHTAATMMVQNGASMKDVADVLGHRSLATTGIYVKLDEPSLRDVALPWAGGGL
jgi:site-specific recombinase XerD